MGLIQKLNDAMKRRSPPFTTPKAEAEAIEKLLASDYAKKLKTYDPVRLARFKCDGIRAMTELLLTNSQSYSQR